MVVVVPEDNLAYRAVGSGRTVTSPPLVRRFPHLDTVEEVMCASLKEPNAQFAMVAPALVLEGVAQSLPVETADWASYWRERYGV